MRAGRHDEGATLPPARLIFTATIFLGSFLLFLTQPMVARMAMPRLGGTPAVWNSAMLLYQALLLAGYAYAHVLGRLPTRVQLGVHLGLFALAALTLPVSLAGVVPALGAEPALWVLWLLGATIAPLFFVIAAQAPLMQSWFARSGDAGAHDPYFLYAASNLGSFAGLITYPLLFEPFLTLSQQSLLWSGGYLLLALGVILCGLMVPPAPGRRARSESTPLGWQRPLKWVLLAAIPSGLLLSSTMHLTTEVLAAPFLWVIPLGVYLLTFVLAFAHRGRLVQGLIALAPFVVLLLGAVVMIEGRGLPFILAVAGVVLLFFAALGLHARLVDDRPDPSRLTEFYLSMSFGGMLGGLFAALIAPLLFNWTWEHPLLVLAAVALLPVPAIFRDPGASRPWAWLIGIPVVALGLSLLADSEQVTGLPRWASILLGIPILLWTLRSAAIRWRYALLFGLLMMGYGGWTALARSFDPDARERSYFGIYGIEATRDGTARYLRHGTTMHGIQLLDPERAAIPGSYYAPGSAVGLAFGNAQRLYGTHARLGVIGLGTGTLVCYARPGQQWTAFEIDPLIVRIARDSRRFTFLSRCKPDLDIVVGDARLMLDRYPDDSFDMLAVDAFSSDAIPMHLMTLEAFQLYDRVLADNGLLLVHISNRYLDLEPVVAAAARAGGWNALLRDYRPGEEGRAFLASRSIWVAMSKDPEALRRLIEDTADDDSGWRPVRGRHTLRPWTDDFGSVLPVLK